MKNKKGIIYSLIAAVVLLSSTFSCLLMTNGEVFAKTTPTVSEAGIKKEFYRYAVAECVSKYPNLLRDDISIGQNIKDIFDYSVDAMFYTDTYVGPWLPETTDGYISCQDAISKAELGDKVTETTLNGLLKGVYEKAASPEKKLYCKYMIVKKDEAEVYQNADGTDIYYTWPQGISANSHDYGFMWSDHLYQDWKDAMRPLPIYFNDNGFVNKESNTSNYTWTLEGVTHEYSTEGYADLVMNSASFNKDDLKGTCKSIVERTSILPYEFKEGSNWISPVKHTDDGTPLKDNFPFHNYSWAALTAKTYIKAEVEDSDGEITALVKTSDAGTKFKSNVSTEYFGGKTLKEAMSGAGFQYILYGRMLFNGDNDERARYYNCGGISLVKNKKNEDWAAGQDYWTFSNDYVKITKAYNSGTATSKTEYITKFGTNRGKNDEGYMPTSIMSYMPWDDSYLKCTDIYNTFIGLTTTNAVAKTTVKGYINADDNQDSSNTSSGTGTNTGDPSDPSDPADDKETKEEACYQHARSLGWIICPMIFGLEEVSKGVYKGIEPFIMVHESIINDISTGSNSGGGSILPAWVTFRDMANIIFVILLLFVIFSQVTGFGIDNYGIKRLLPKLIVTAILVNLSFIICAVAVDLSNILGRSLQEFFVSLKVSSTPGNDVVSATTDNIGKVVEFLMASGTMAAGAAGVAAIMLEGWTLIIPILLFLLVMIISIIFGFIILGVRQAMVIVLLVISPIAMACNVLPNTQKLYQKWFTAFKGVLIVYPICGALIGGGNFAGRVLLGTSGDFLLTIIAGLLSVVPYFFVPSLMRKSMDALGNIGAKIGNMGNRLGGKAKSSIGNSQGVKGWQQDASNRQAQARANRFLNSRRGKALQEDVKNGRKISGRNARRLTTALNNANNNTNATIGARTALSQYNRLSSQNGFEAAMSSANMAEDAITTGNYEKMLSAGDYAFSYTDEQGNAHDKIDYQDNSALAKALQHELQQTGDNYDANKIRALTNALASKGKDGRKGIFNAVNAAQQSPGGMSKQAVKDFSSNIMNNHGNMKDKDRTIYEYAKQTAASGDTSESIASFAGAGAGSMTAADIVGMDKQQLDRYLKTESYTKSDGSTGTRTIAEFSDNVDPNGGDENGKKLAEIAQRALSDEHLSQDLAFDQRQRLEKIVQAGGLTVPTQVKTSMSGDSGTILSHNHEAAMGAYQDRVNRRVASGDITAEEGKKMIANAKAHFYDKDNKPTPPPAPTA